MALLNCAFRLLFRRIFYVVTAMSGFHTAWVQTGIGIAASARSVIGAQAPSNKRRAEVGFPPKH
jgi:hypothetical protein